MRDDMYPESSGGPCLAQRDGRPCVYADGHEGNHRWRSVGETRCFCGGSFTCTPCLEREEQEAQHAR